MLDAQPLSTVLKSMPDQYDHYVEKYISLLKKIHKTKGDKSVYGSIKDLYFEAIEECKSYYSDVEIGLLRGLVASVPDTDTLIHGDYHPNNIMVQDDKLILIDMGTATTITLVDKDKNYRGGMILPGLRVSLDSLTSRTSQLPRISLDPPKRLIGTNTNDCMKSGILYGSASMLDGMIERIEDEIGMKTTVVATGGLANAIVPLCKHEIIPDDDLLLRGLRYIYERNS